MRVTRLQIAGLRSFAAAALDPGPGLNLITGDNGTGKSTLLEALHLMAYGRSFRGRVRDGLVRTGCDALEVFVEWREGTAPARGPSGPGPAYGPAQPGPVQSTGRPPSFDAAPAPPPAPASGVATSPSPAATAADRNNVPTSDATRLRRAGLRHTGQAWKGRLDGADVAQLGDLCAALAVVTFEPGSHALVSGGGEPRRRYLDWGLFHVEQDFLALWRRHARALRQRNALLRNGASASQLDAWDHELAESGEPLTRRREQYLDRLQHSLAEIADALIPSLGTATLEFQPGWRRSEMSLADALLLARDRDRTLGHTTVGPHRADWSVRYTALPSREPLSRGQAKLTALASLLAQAEDYARQRGEWPIIALDDLASELDRNHQQRVVDRLLSSGAQAFITGTEPPPALAAAIFGRFHVEQGSITAL